MSINEILRPKSQEEIHDLKERGFCFDEGSWRFIIYLVDMIEETADTKNLVKFKTNVVNLLKDRKEDLSTLCEKSSISQLNTIIHSFESLSNNLTGKDLDEVMNQLYDWGDRNRVWIKSCEEE